jgi:hypothetical protein
MESSLVYPMLAEAVINHPRIFFTCINNNVQVSYNSFLFNLEYVLFTDHEKKGEAELKRLRDLKEKMLENLNGFIKTKPEAYQLDLAKKFMKRLEEIEPKASNK